MNAAWSATYGEGWRWDEGEQLRTAWSNPKFSYTSKWECKAPPTCKYPFARTFIHPPTLGGGGTQELGGHRGYLLDVPVLILVRSQNPSTNHCWLSTISHVSSGEESSSSVSWAPSKATNRAQLHQESSWKGEMEYGQEKEGNVPSCHIPIWGAGTSQHVCSVHTQWNHISHLYLPQRLGAPVTLVKEETLLQRAPNSLRFYMGETISQKPHFTSQRLWAPPPPPIPDTYPLCSSW